MSDFDDDDAAEADPDAGWPRDLSRAAACLTVVRRDPAAADPAGMVAAARAYPVIGIALGVAAAAAYGLGDGLGFYGLASAALAFALIAALTGARGETGAAAFIARLCGGAADERTSAQAGLILVVFGIVLRIGLVAAVSFASTGAAIVIAAVTVSRIAMPLAAAWAGPSGLPDPAGEGEDRRRLWVVALVGFLLLILFLGLWGAVVSAVLAAGAAVALVAAASRTGELDRPALWAVQQAVEIAVLAGAVATL